MDGKAGEKEDSSEFADGADVLASFIAAADTDTAVEVLNRAALSTTCASAIWWQRHPPSRRGWVDCGRLM